MKPLTLLLFLLIPLTLVHAQQAPPLQAPLLALNTIDQEAVFLYDVGNQRYRRLALGAGAHHVWDFSPDGCRVLLTMHDGVGYGRLWSVALDGSDARELLRYDDLPPERWGVWEPDWSPDGERIAFTMIRAQYEEGDLVQQHHIAYVTTDNPAPEFYSVTGREFSPRWSPDGSWLVYVSYDERVAGANVFATAAPTAEPPPGQTPPPPTLLNEADLWLVQADGSGKFRLSNFSTGSVSQPRWSPDGELISFVYSPSANNDTLWMISRQEGSIPTQLSYQWTLMLDHTWLPDATGVIAAMRDFQNISENRLWQIPLVNTGDDSAASLYLPEIDIPHADFPAFSPDGRWLALRSAYELQLLHLETGEQSRLDASVLGNSPPVWSPEGFTGEADCR